MQPCCFHSKNSARSHRCCPLIDSTLKRGQTTTNWRYSNRFRNCLKLWNLMKIHSMPRLMNCLMKFQLTKRRKMTAKTIQPTRRMGLTKDCLNC